MPNIKSKPKQEMMSMLDKAEGQIKVFHSVASEMYKFAPRKLNSLQKNKVKEIAEKAADLIVKGLPNAKKSLKKHYSQEDWERDCKLVEEVLAPGTAKMVAHAQEIKNLANNDFGQTLEASLDTTVVPTMRLCVEMIRNACDMLNYAEVCLSEAFHDDWDLIVEVEDIVPERDWERYKNALESLDKEMRKSYESKKKNLEKTYGKSLHRSIKPEMDYYVEEKS